MRKPHYNINISKQKDRTSSKVIAPTKYLFITSCCRLVNRSLAKSFFFIYRLGILVQTDITYIDGIFNMNGFKKTFCERLCLKHIKYRRINENSLVKNIFSLMLFMLLNTK